MKKILLSSLLASSLLVSANAAGMESGSGAFVGLNVGGMIAGGVSSGVSFNSSVAVGLKGGYQSFFTEVMGARFYVSGIAAFGLLAVPPTGGANGGMNVNLSVMADLNADMLFNFISDQSFTTGMYLGFFGGALIETPIYKFDANSAGSNKTSTTVGINIGSRTTVNEHHEFDIGAKVGAAFYIEGATNVVGMAMYVGSSYSYKF